jgi:glycosyltransferase involved in cell wall biosynthesis
VIRYAIVTPARDEEKYIAATVEAVASQTILPEEWIVVDDGSTDRTSAILGGYAARLPWLRVVHRPNRGFRKAGGGVVDAFYEGYNALGSRDWEFIVKLDGDLTFERDYFERCFGYFRAEPKLGIGGGGIYHLLRGKPTLEVNPRFHVRGATKIYRRECWEAIGGLWRAAGWDTIDEVKANMLGWSTRSFNELRLLHHRLTGAASGPIPDRAKRGVACYVSGYHPLFVAASCVRRLVQKPYIIGSLALFYGFVKAHLTKTPRVEDPQLKKYIRAQQLRRLCGLESIWR